MLARILTLTIFRVVLFSLLLVYQLLGVFVDIPILPFPHVVFAVSAVFVLTACSLLYLQRHSARSDLNGVIFIQFFFDILMITGLVVLTGDEGSHLRFGYLLIIVLAAIFLDRISIYVIMVLSLAFYFLALSSNTFIFGVNSNFSKLSLANLYSGVMIGHTLLCFLTALISGFMQSAYRSGRRALHVQEERVRSLQEIRNIIVEILPSGLITCDQDGLIEFVNNMGRKILQKENEELIGQNAWLLMGLKPPDATNGSQLQNRAETRVPIAGVKRIFGISYRPMSIEPGNIGYMMVFQDLTKIKLLESHKLLADKMAAIGKVAAGVAHEIRNPLASVSGSIQVLKEFLPEDPTALELSDIVLRETKRLDNIISEFLTYAKPSAPPYFEPIAIVDCIQDFLKLLKNDTQMQALQVRTDFPKDSPIVMADQAKLKQVFWNLMRNSFEACNDQPIIEIGCAMENQDVLVWIQDNGIGMTEDQLKDLFTPFLSFSKTGSGLGMSIVYDMIQLHHGHIDVTSKINEGTRVTLRFPPYEEIV